MESSHSPRFRGIVGFPRVTIYLSNVRAEPIGDGVLRLHILDHYSHGAAWEAIADRIGRDAKLHLDGNTWTYRLEVESDQVYLLPLDRTMGDPPDSLRLSRKAVNIELKW